MIILHKIAETREYIAKVRREGRTIGLVPTMGYFHEGHLSLMQRAKAENDFVVVSLLSIPRSLVLTKILPDILVI